MIWITYATILTNIFVIAKTEAVEMNETEQGPTRRILGGTPAGDTRPYMVYLLAASGGADPGWTCGGAILDARHVLTSAACVEDHTHFYVVAGTHRWVPASDKENTCIKNGAKKAVWKCVPKNYVFDGAEFDNIRWLSGDIAVVRVEDAFNFKRRVRGCDYAPRPIAYNNVSAELEQPGTQASIAGWGSTHGFSDHVGRSGSQNSLTLLQASVVLQQTDACTRGWPARYHRAIQGMLCAGDRPADTMTRDCAENEVNCKEIVYSNENGTAKDGPPRRQMARHRAADHRATWHRAGDHRAARRTQDAAGGFCENDHGGPLVVGRGVRAVVAGVVAACRAEGRERRCRGPFLYSSVYRHRALIACALYGQTDPTCRRVLRSDNNHTEEAVDWSHHPDGPAKSEVIDSAKDATFFRSIIPNGTAL